MMKSPKIRRIAKSIEERVRQSGYENAFDFHKRSGINIAYYTVVRFFDPEQATPPSIPTIIEIAHYSGMSPTEIKNILRDLGDPFWHKLIGGEDAEPMTPKEAAMISGIRKVVNSDTSMWSQFGSTLSLAAKATGVDCSDELAVIG